MNRKTITAKKAVSQHLTPRPPGPGMSDDLSQQAGASDSRPLYFILRSPDDPRRLAVNQPTPSCPLIPKRLRACMATETRSNGKKTAPPIHDPFGKTQQSLLCSSGGTGLVKPPADLRSSRTLDTKEALLGRPRSCVRLWPTPDSLAATRNTSLFETNPTFRLIRLFYPSLSSTSFAAETRGVDWSDGVICSNLLITISRQRSPQGSR